MCYSFNFHEVAVSVIELFNFQIEHWSVVELLFLICSIVFLSVMYYSFYFHEAAVSIMELLNIKINIFLLN